MNEFYGIQLSGPQYLATCCLKVVELWNLPSDGLWRFADTSNYDTIHIADLNPGSPVCQGQSAFPLEAMYMPCAMMAQSSLVKVSMAEVENNHRLVLLNNFPQLSTSGCRQLGPQLADTTFLN